MQRGDISRVARKSFLKRRVIRMPINKIKRLPLIMSIVLFAIFLAGIIFSCIFTALRNEKSEFSADISYYAGNIGQMYEHEDISYLGTLDGRVVAFDKTGEKLWENVSGEEDKSAVRVISAEGNRIYAAYSNCRIVVFDSISGEIVNVYLARSASDIQIIPEALKFSRDAEWFAVCGAYGQRQAIALFETSAKGTMQTPQRMQDDMICEMANIECFAFGDKADIYYANSTGRIYRVSADNFTSAKLVGKTESGNALKALAGTEENGFIGVDDGGILYTFDDEWNVAEKKDLHTDISTAIECGDDFLCKSPNGGVFLIKTETKKIAFRIETDADALILFSSLQMFAVSSEGKISFYDVKLAERIGTYTALVWVGAVAGALACLAGICCVLNVTQNGSKKFRAFFAGVGRAFWKNRLVYFSLIPVVAVIGVFCYVPMVWSIILSFWDYLPGVHSVWVGFENFKLVVQTQSFWQSCIPMFVFLFADLIKALVPPIVFAECLIAIKRKMFSFWARCLLFIPGILPGVATTLLWINGIFGEYGLVNQVASIFVPEWVSFNFLSRSSTSLASIIMFGLPWVGSYLIFYGAIMGLPTSMYEAAKLDGCGWIKRIFSLDLPLILPQIKYIVITTFIASVQSYTNMYIVSNGNLPMANELGIGTPAYHMYYELMHNMNYGTASAMGVFLFLFLLVATIINFRMQSDKS